MRRLVRVPGKFIPLVLGLMVLWPHVALALTASQVYERVQDSVVVVKALDREGKTVGLGSGVALPSGDIATNHHVIKGGVRYTVGQRGKTAPAFLQRSDPDKDLALLLAPGLTASPARLGQTSRLKVGEPVYAVGAPQGLELSLSEGIISQLRGAPPPLIQTTVAISPGSSGGGLFNAEGELVGITTFRLKEGQSLNFALPVEWIKEVAAAPAPRPGPRVSETGPGAPAPGKKAAEGWSDRAIALEKAQDWHGLLAHCREWTRAEQDSDYAWFYLGVSYGKLGRYREAIEANREALRLKPDDAKAWYNLGVAYGKLKSYREAIEAFRETLRLKPDHAETWYNIGTAYGQLKSYREAIEAYREALRLKPDHAKAWNNLAVAYALSGNRRAALAAVKELRRHDPQQADKLFNLVMRR